jgi:hypothetical protein
VPLGVGQAVGGDVLEDRGELGGLGAGLGHVLELSP